MAVIVIDMNSGEVLGEETLPEIEPVPPVSEEHLHWFQMPVPQLQIVTDLD